MCGMLAHLLLLSAGGRTNAKKSLGRRRRSSFRKVKVPPAALTCPLLLPGFSFLTAEFRRRRAAFEYTVVVHPQIFFFGLRTCKNNSSIMDRVDRASQCKTETHTNETKHVPFFLMPRVYQPDLGLPGQISLTLHK